MREARPHVVALLALSVLSVLGVPHGASAALHARIPSATPSPFPFHNGDTWITSVSGTETVTYPSSPPTTIPYSYMQSDMETCPVTFNNYTNICADQFLQSKSPNETETFYFGYFANGSLTDFSQVGGSLSTANGNTSTTDVWTMTPGDIYLQFGGSPGSQYNGLSGLYRESDATYGPHRYLSTASYVATQNFYERRTSVSDPQNKTKSHTYEKVTKGGAGEYDYTQTGANPSSTKETFGKPVLSSGSWVIPVTIDTGSGPTTVNVPDWFPGGGPAPAKLDAIEIQDDGPVQMPSACGPYAGTQAEHYSYVKDVYLQPVVGWYWTYQGDTYVVFGIGAVCVLEAYGNSYYDNTSTGGLIASYQFADTQIMQSYSFPQALMRGLATGSNRKSAPSAVHQPGRFLGALQPFGGVVRGIPTAFGSPQ